MTRDKDFDKEAKLRKLDFLVCEELSSPENIQDGDPDEPIKLKVNDDPDCGDKQRNIFNDLLAKGVRFPRNNKNSYLPWSLGFG